jgi:hypothetical protein
MNRHNPVRGSVQDQKRSREFARAAMKALYGLEYGRGESRSGLSVPQRIVAVGATDRRVPRQRRLIETGVDLAGGKPFGQERENPPKPRGGSGNIESRSEGYAGMETVRKGEGEVHGLKPAQREPQERGKPTTLVFDQVHEPGEVVA